MNDKNLDFSTRAKGVYLREILEVESTEEV